MSTAVTSLVLSSWQVTLLRHITTFNLQPEDNVLSSANKPTVVSTPTSKLGSTASVSTMPSLFVAESSAHASSSTTSQQQPLPSEDHEPPHFPDNGKNYGLTINRAWVDTHSSLLRTDPGLYISVRGIKDADEPDGKRSQRRIRQTTRFKVARRDVHADAATASHAANDESEGKSPEDEFSDDESPDDDATSVPPLDAAFTPDMEDALSEEEPEEDIPKEAVMDIRKPDISLIDLPLSNEIPQDYLWRQCAVFMEMKQSARDGHLGDDTLNARKAEHKIIPNRRVSWVSKSIITQMADNARLLMATRPFLYFCLHITFCGRNFNLVLCDRNGVIISRSYDFKKHLAFFIRIIRRLSREMTAYDLGFDTTVCLEGCMGSADYPSYLVKISDGVWYRTEGVPLWQSTSLIGRGTLVFNAREHSEPNGPLQILKNAWREDGRPKESELYKLVQNSGDAFESPKALAKFVKGGDVPLHDGRMVTTKGHRLRFGSEVIGNGATLHRVVLASRGKSLASYGSLKQLLKAAWVIVVGKELV